MSFRSMSLQPVFQAKALSLSIHFQITRNSMNPKQARLNEQHTHDKIFNESDDCTVHVFAWRYIQLLIDYRYLHSDVKRQECFLTGSLTHFSNFEQMS